MDSIQVFIPPLEKDQAGFLPRWAVNGGWRHQTGRGRASHFSCVDWSLNSKDGDRGVAGRKSHTLYSWAHVPSNVPWDKLLRDWILPADPTFPHSPGVFSSCEKRISWNWILKQADLLRAATKSWTKLRALHSWPLKAHPLLMLVPGKTVWGSIETHFYSGCTMWGSYNSIMEEI